MQACSFIHPSHLVVGAKKKVGGGSEPDIVLVPLGTQSVAEQRDRLDRISPMHLPLCEAVLTSRASRSKMGLGSNNNKNNHDVWHFLNTCYMPGSVLNTFPLFCDSVYLHSP